MASFTRFVCLLTLLITKVNAHPLEDIPSNTTLSNRSLPPIRPNDPKRGLSFHDATFIQKWSGPGSQVSGAYNWDSVIPADSPKNLEYIPMLWSAGVDHTNQVILIHPVNKS